MILLLEFDLFYTVIKIPKRLSNLLELEDEFLSWIYSSELYRQVYDDGTYCYVYDDKVFIEWLKKFKLKETEKIELIKNHISGSFDNSLLVDGKIFF